MVFELMQDFPDLEYQQIYEVLQAMNFNHQETLDTLKSSRTMKIEVISLDTFERSDISDTGFDANVEGM